jgi:hypothetical protein
MWLFTEHGFFSTVKDRYCNDNELMVRCRVKGDADALAGKTGHNPDEIIDLDRADYAYRLKLTRDEWAAYMRDTVMGIDYANVKDAIGGKGPRYDAYLQCWGALFLLQRMMKNR